MCAKSGANSTKMLLLASHASDEHLLRLATIDSGVNMAITSLQQLIRRAERAFLKGLRVGKDHFHVFGTHAVQQSAHLLLGILLCELQVLA